MARTIIAEDELPEFLENLNIGVTKTFYLKEEKFRIKKLRGN